MCLPCECPNFQNAPGIHERARQRIAAGLNHAGKGATDHVEGMIGGNERKYADRKPFGVDRDGHFERSVLTRQPGQGAGFGEAHRGVIVGVMAAAAKIIEPKVAGGRNTTWPSAKCGASSLAISCCAKAGVGQRISSAWRTASAMSVVTAASCTLCRPLESFRVMREPAARCYVTCAASRRHRRTSWP